MDTKIPNDTIESKEEAIIQEIKDEIELTKLDNMNSDMNVEGILSKKFGEYKNPKLKPWEVV